MKEKYTVSEQKADTAELTSQNSLCLQQSVNQKNIQSATAESQAISRKTILKDRSNICRKDILMQKSSETSDPDLISNGKDSEGYWNEFCRERSSHLWLPTETDLQDSGQISLNTLSTKMVENSWFSTRFHYLQNRNSQEICLQSCTYFPADCMDSESIRTKSRKIRIYPDQSQKAVLRQWLGTARFVYNKTVEYLKQKGTKADWKKIKTSLLSGLPLWAKEVPFQIKSIAIRDACLAVKAAKKRFRETGIFNEVKYKRRKNRKQTIFIPKSAVKTGKGFYVKMLKTMCSGETIPEALYDCRMSYSAGRWYLIVPVRTADKPENQGKVVSVDPGVRTFLTFYSAEACGKLGQGDFSRIQRLCHYADDLISRKTRAVNHHQKYRMNKALDRIRCKLKDLVNELHHKTALFLVRNFSLIIIPKFETSEMVNRTKRRIRSKTARSMLTFSHYRFQEFLKHKAGEYGRTVIHQDEAYTSKTCSWNGKMKKIGSAKYIKDGNIVVDRDYNGARGIYLRALRDPAMPGRLAWHAIPNIGTIGNYGGLLVG